jgi:hypothetical protein
METFRTFYLWDQWCKAVSIPFFLTSFPIFLTQVCVFLLCSSLCFPHFTQTPIAFGQISWLSEKMWKNRFFTQALFVQNLRELSFTWDTCSDVALNSGKQPHLPNLTLAVGHLPRSPQESPTSAWCFPRGLPLRAASLLFQILELHIS